LCSNINLEYVTQREHYDNTNQLNENVSIYLTVDINWITNAIIVNINKGIELINSIKDDLVHKICKLDEIVDGNPSLVKSSNRSSKRDEFFNEIDVLSIKDLVNKYIPKRSIFNRIKGKVKGIIKRFVNK